jgi:hypothetical protein
MLNKCSDNDHNGISIPQSLFIFLMLKYIVEIQPVAKKFDGIIEAVRYKNGHIEVVRTFERWGAVFSDRVFGMTMVQLAIIIALALWLLVVVVSLAYVFFFQPRG